MHIKHHSHTIGLILLFCLHVSLAGQNASSLDNPPEKAHITYESLVDEILESSLSRKYFNGRYLSTLLDNNWQEPKGSPGTVFVNVIKKEWGVISDKYQLISFMSLTMGEEYRTYLILEHNNKYTLMAAEAKDILKTLEHIVEILQEGLKLWETSVANSVRDFHKDIYSSSGYIYEQVESKMVFFVNKNGVPSICILSAGGQLYDMEIQSGKQSLIELDMGETKKILDFLIDCKGKMSGLYDLAKKSAQQRAVNEIKNNKIFNNGATQLKASSEDVEIYFKEHPDKHIELEGTIKKLFGEKKYDQALALCNILPRHFRKLKEVIAEQKHLDSIPMKQYRDSISGTPKPDGVYDLADLDGKPTPRGELQSPKLTTGGVIGPERLISWEGTGIVVVQFIVDSKGNVRDVVVASSSHQQLEAPSINAVKKWKFTPGKKDGKAVNTRLEQTFVFDQGGEVYFNAVNNSVSITTLSHKFSL